MNTNPNPDITKLFAGAMGFIDEVSKFAGQAFAGEKTEGTVVEYTLASDIKVGQQVVLPSGEYTHVAAISGDLDVVELEFATGEYFDFLSNTQVRTR
jgi:hypothetical protein